MQDTYEVFAGSTVDAGFVKKHLEEKGVECFVENLKDESITASWTPSNDIIGTKVMVFSQDFVKARKILKDYFNSRDN